MNDWIVERSVSPEHVCLCSESIEVIVTGSGDRWGNFFFLESHTLHINFSALQHEVAMHELNISREQILVSGFFHDDIVIVRNSSSCEFVSSVQKLVESHLKRI